MVQAFLGLRLEQQQLLGALCLLLPLLPMARVCWASPRAAAASPTWKPGSLLESFLPGPALALGGFGVERPSAAGADHAAVQRDTPAAKVGAGLTQSAPRVNGFVKCSRSLTLSLWVRSPWPERAALCLRRKRSVLCRSATNCWFYCKNLVSCGSGSRWDLVGTEPGGSCSGASSLNTWSILTPSFCLH